MARLNWKECSSATARSNSFCASALHDVAKCTAPNFSLFPCSCSCATLLAASSAMAHPAKTLVVNICTLPPDYRRGSAETESLSQDDRGANSSDPDGELQSSDHHANEVDAGWRHTPVDHHQHRDVLVH